MQQTLDVSNAVAAELAGISDGVLDALRERLTCTVRLRGNQLTLEGDTEHVENARAVIDELVELVEGGHQIGSHTVDAVLGTLEAGQDVRDVFDAVVWRHRGKKIAPKTVTQKEYVDLIRRSTVTFGIGPAGTGKTYLAMAMAVAALHEREVSRIILTRPAVEAGERLGFLPGDLMAKVDPYLRPLFDALYDMLDPDKALSLIERGTIEVAPLAFMRGRTLNDSFIILDEAQNTSPEQMQMFLTRLGFGSKVVVTGDVTQIDLPREQRSGLVHVRDVLRRHRRHQLRRVRPPRCRAAQARAANRRGLQGAHRRAQRDDLGRGRQPKRRRGRRAGRGRAGRARAALGGDRRRRARDRVRRRGRDARAEARAPRLDEATDVLSFPIDGRDAVPDGVPRALGDVVLCPQVVGDEWRWPLTHGLLHLLGYDHGDEMEAREEVLLAMSAQRVRPASSTPSTTRSKGSSTCSARSGTCGSTSRSRSSCSSFALVVNVTKLELIALLISITFVLIAEMLNSAVEAAIDIATTSFDPMAKLAKDIAAGAVLIATIERDRGRLPRLRRQGRRPLGAPARPAARRRRPS